MLEVIKLETKFYRFYSNFIMKIKPHFMHKLVTLVRYENKNHCDYCYYIYFFWCSRHPSTLVSLPQYFRIFVSSSRSFLFSKEKKVYIHRNEAEKSRRKEILRNATHKLITCYLIYINYLIAIILSLLYKRWRKLMFVYAGFQPSVYVVLAHLGWSVGWSGS
jgi:hypothetical protein